MSTRARSAAAQATTQLWAACEADREDLDAVRMAIDAGAAVDVRNKEQRTPLHTAAIHDYTATAQLLIQAGATVDARSKVQRTPLHDAAYNGHTATAQLLIQAGATVDARDYWQQTPLTDAVMFGNTATATLLLQAGADPLHGMGSIADPGLAHTQTLLADRATVPATLDHLRVHALRHLGDQPTLAARILELIAARPAP